LWPFLKPNAHEDNLLNNPNAIGQSISQISTYFDNFWIKNTNSPSYVGILLGFNSDYNLFLENARVMLEEFPTRLYRKPLQAAQTMTIGWLFSSHEDMSLPNLSQLLNSQICHLNPVSTTYIIGLKYKPIWDGTPRNTQTNGRKGTWAIHIDAILTKHTLHIPYSRRLSNLLQSRPTLTSLFYWSQLLPTALHRVKKKTSNELSPAIKWLNMLFLAASPRK